MIPHSRPDLGAQEAEAAAAVVAGGAVAQGDQVRCFEDEVASVLGQRFGIATSSGTAALQLTLQAIGVRDRHVLMPSYVCSALVHAAHASGGRPLLVDVDGCTGNMEQLPAAEPTCAAAILPHMFGRASPLASRLAERLPLIEDLAMALGTEGVGTAGLAAVCSFYATKVITAAGEGGMVVTDDESLARELRAIREYDGHVLDRPRWNYKLTDVAAAVGRVQLRRLPELLARRSDLAARYDEVTGDCGFRRPDPGQDPRVGQNHFRYVLSVPQESLQSMLQEFSDHGVGARRPVPTGLHDALSSAAGSRGTGASGGLFPGTRRMLTTALSLPLYPSLTENEVQQVLAAAQAVLCAHRQTEVC